MSEQSGRRSGWPILLVAFALAGGIAWFIYATAGR